MTDTKEADQQAPKLGVLTGMAEVTCPRCKTEHRTGYFSLAQDGVSLCDDCVEQTDDKSHLKDVLEALEELDTALWLAQTDGVKGIVMANHCMLIMKAVQHLADKYMPKLES